MNGYTINQITDNNIIDTDPQISEGNIVWSANDGNDDEIFLYDGNSITQLTDNEVFESFPQISGDNLVWQQTQNDPFSINTSDGSRVIFYDGTTTRTLASRENIIFPGISISGDSVVWVEFAETQDLGLENSLTSEGIFLFDGSDTVELSNSGFVSGSDFFSENEAVWTDRNEIFYYDGTNTTQITQNSTVVNSNPIVSEGNIAWNSFARVDGETDLTTGEVFFFDGSEIIQLTNNNITDRVVGISGNNVVWESGNVFGETDLFLYDGSETIQLTDGEVDTENFYGGISGNQVVWSEDDGNDLEVFLYDGNTTIRLTDNNLDDVASDIEGENIVWKGTDGSNNVFDAEIFLATPNATAEAESPTIYRFYNNDTGGHFYTASETEKDAVEKLDNYSFEGASYQGVATVEPESTPVYRFYNNDTGIHFYTTSETEKEAVEELDNFSFEGEVFSAYDTQVQDSIPIYRFYNFITGAHFYTSSTIERDAVVDLPDYQSEGIAYFALPIAEDSSI